MQTINRSAPDHARDIDEIRRLSETIAQELWRLYGGRGTMNWVGAERHLNRLAKEARSDVRNTRATLRSLAADAHRQAYRVMRPGNEGRVGVQGGRT